ncbi:MAG: hypothetical protein PHG31_02240 [Candidatus Omnitrophica bacterium]|nr:hypothetical protein [Candidatus Omnitrophota bacterium]
MLAISLVVVGFMLRIIPHVPNFTPVAAIALFGAAYLKKKHACVVALLLMVASDLIIGMHNVVFFTWGGFLLVALMGMPLKKNRGPVEVFGFSLLGSFVFFIVSNFGVWVMGWYPHTLQGLISCYAMALPFLRDFTVATLVYATLFFGVYEIIASRVRNTRFARVLLTDF